MLHWAVTSSSVCSVAPGMVTVTVSWSALQTLKAKGNVVATPLPWKIVLLMLVSSVMSYSYASRQVIQASSCGLSLPSLAAMP